MSKKSNKASVPADAMQDVEMLLAGIESGIPEGLLASEILGIEDSFTSEPDDLDALVDEGWGGGSIDANEVVETKPIDTGVIPFDKTAIYAEQDSTVGVGSDEESAPVKGKGKRVKAASTKEPKAPRVITTGMSRADTLVAKGNLEELTKIGIQEGEIPDLVGRINALPNKVQDKAYNLIRFAAGRESLSNYTRFVIEELCKDGSLKIPEIVKRMEVRGWSSGTSRSQAQQVSRLMRAYNMTQSDSPLELNTTSPFVTTILDRLSLTAA